MSSATAAGKAILLGEHAVVYGRPAIAVPVSDVRATATVEPLPRGQGVWIIAADLGRTFALDGSEADEQALPLGTTARNALDYLAVPAAERDLRLTIHSMIPIARGMGSGTAVATALVRALAAHYGQTLAPATVSELVYRTEIILHGHPSGIDNTVVAYERPIFFRRGQPMATLDVGAPIHLLIGDTGVAARTRDTVALVRRGWEAQPTRYEALFDAIAAAVVAARAALAAGDAVALGAQMDANQQLLCALGVSSTELDRLVLAAPLAGAWGAKLSGGGGGGCMLALVCPDAAAQVEAALVAAGAVRVIRTVVRETSP
ncbi:MAG: mevalonate kinase, partial [Chloroflexota bacterium]